MNNKPAIAVTGGSTGIGAKICQQLLQEDYCVLNLARRQAPFKHNDLYNVPLDLSDPQAVSASAAKLAQQFNIIGLVHNAGLIRPNLLEKVPLDDLNYLTQVHLGSAISLTQALLPSLKACSRGRVVFISSRAALGLATRTVYSATKAGMIAMARTWALELGQYGITVNTIAPGPIEATEMFDAMIEEGSEQKKALAASIPVQRIGRPEDVANAVSFFIKPQSNFITGQTLMVCGGASLGSLSL